MKRIRIICLFLVNLCCLSYVMQGQDKYEVAEKVPGVNSKYVESGPRITPDGQRMYFFRTDHPANLKKTNDIWYADRTSDTSWGEPNHMGEPLNCYGNNNVHDISQTGDTLLLHNRYLKNKTMMSGVSYSVRKNGGWSFPKHLKIKNYHNDTLCTFALNPAGDVMIMGIKHKDTRGAQDLYVSFRKEGRKWSEPENLGDQINSPQSEVCAFISKDGKRLYYSSKGRDTKGGYDVFMAKRKDTTWLNWTAPKNMGEPINSEGNDLYFFKQGPDKKYVASDRGEEDKSDIYRFFTPVITVKGAFFSSQSNDSIEGKITVDRIDPETGDTTQVTVERGKNFEFELEGGYKYQYSASADDHIDLSKDPEIDATDLTNDKTKSLDISLDPLKVGVAFELDHIYFKTDESELLPKSYPKLKAVVRALKDIEELKVEIQGHTDDRGPAEYNRKLSQKRAESVVNYLIEQGIDSTRLAPKGYGESEPRATNATEAGRQKNRRVEFKVLEMEDKDDESDGATGSNDQQNPSGTGTEKASRKNNASEPAGESSGSGNNSSGESW